MIVTVGGRGSGKTAMVDIRKHNIDIFKATRITSLGRYYEHTVNMVHNTMIYHEPNLLSIDLLFTKTYEPHVNFTNRGTIAAAYYYAEKDLHVAALNFADAITPGGLVLYGEVTQEENICRCTNLYEALISEKAQTGYYAVNNRHNHTSKYTHTLIYSPNVLIFKDDMNYNEVPLRYVDIISCPAPCGGITYKMKNLLTARIIGIIKSAVVHGVDILILGAWGCGAFGQDPKIVAQIFGEVLSDYAHYFKCVDFAIRENTETQSSNWDIFQKNFLKTFAPKF